MAVANFFDRALLGASQAVQGMDPDAIGARIKSYVVELGFDRSAAASTEGRLALDMSVRLLARLYPALKITALDGETKLKRGLEQLARSINPGDQA